MTQSTHSDNQIAENYSSGMLLENIREGLRRGGVDPDHASYEDLAGGDEFHVGGVEATDALLDQLGIDADSHVLDVGAGIGGPARRVAHRFGCRVTGIDLTPEFVAAAEALTAAVGMDDRVAFHVGSGTDIPLDDASVDVALLIHVGMNIAAKDALFREVARVLRPGGTFAVYDGMTGPGSEPLTFPLPWARDAGSSHVEPRAAYVAAAEAAGLALVAERDRSSYGLDFMREMMQRVAAEGPPPLGPHLFMRDTAKQRMMNATEAISDGRIVLNELIFRRAA